MSSSSKPKVIWVRTSTGETVSFTLPDPSQPGPSEPASILFNNLYNKGADTIDMGDKGSARLAGPSFFRAWDGSKEHFVEDTGCYEIVGSKDPKNQRAPTPAYLKEREVLESNFSRDCVFVDQRGFGVTTGKSQRPLIGTYGVVLCMSIALYDRRNQVAALAHFDKSQDFESLGDVVKAANFGDNDVEVHFYGGCKNPASDMAPATINTTTQLLKALLNVSVDPLNRARFIICSFNIMLRQHSDAITFDSRDGKMYTFCSPLPALLSNGRPTNGNPLERRFKMWLNGTHMANTTTGSGQAVLQEAMSKLVMDTPESSEQPEPAVLSTPGEAAIGQVLSVIPKEVPTRAQVIAYARRARCVWNSVPSQRDFFVNDNNTLICRMIIWQAVATDGQLAAWYNTEKGKTSMQEMIGGLLSLGKPMALEQGLREWFGGKYLIAESSKQIEEGDRLSILEKGRLGVEGSIVNLIQGLLRKNGDPNNANALNAIRNPVVSWLAKNPHPWEGLI